MIVSFLKPLLIIEMRFMDSLKNLQPVVMTIAGSDSGAGAGIQADIKTCAALGVYCTTVLTAITAQNTQRITACEPVSVQMLAQQFDAVTEDFNVAVIKIGMVGSVDNLHYLVARLSDYKRKNSNVFIVLDTPLRASVGFSLLDVNNADLLWKLIRLVDLVTPNLMEAAFLLECAEARSTQMMALQTLQFVERGAKAVLLKGGHLVGDQAADCLLSTDTGAAPVWFSNTKISTRNNHGTGCTLASAIAAQLVLGYPVPEAISRAKQYLHTLLQQSQQRHYGLGSGPLECLNLSRSII
ncbi:bifunctional hydroxymethylpyrimidine kinase/phosphomethylpyrimidine kinase [Simiduia litorea]